MIQGPILKIGVGMDLTIDCLQRKRIWKLIFNLGQSMVSSRPLGRASESRQAFGNVESR